MNILDPGSSTSTLSKDTVRLTVTDPTATFDQRVDCNLHA